MIFRDIFVWAFEPDDKIRIRGRCGRSCQAWPRRGGRRMAGEVQPELPGGLLYVVVWGKRGKAVKLGNTCCR